MTATGQAGKKTINRLIKGYFMRTKKISTVSKGLCSLFFLVFTSVINISADEACFWEISSCPEGLNGETITVPENVIAISPRVRSCNMNVTTEEKGEPPSIFFLIDNSGSMSVAGSGNDINGQRFTVTKQIIDTIYKVFPEAEIGMAVFKNVLSFDDRDYDIFERLDNFPIIDTIRDTSIVREGNREDGYTYDTTITKTSTDYKYHSFLPLIKLNDTITAKDDTKMTGKDFIDLLLDTVVQIEQNRTTYVDLEYQPSFTQAYGTNINAAFEAGLRAMKETENDKKNQFFIFISDGEPTGTNQPDSVADKIEDFAEGGLNGNKAPTTFTIYVSASGNATIPVVLNTMTENIKTNGYSDKNELSDIWSIRTDDLMQLFKDNILQTILNVKSGQTETMSITIGSGDQHFEANEVVIDNNDTFFVFGTKTIALNHESDTTVIGIKASYKFKSDDKDKDTSTASDFLIIRKGNKNPELGEVNCWNRDLELHYNGTSVSSVNETMKELEAVFIDSDGNYSNVTVDITNSDEKKQDKIKNLKLSRSDNKFSNSFQREINDPDINDVTFQHQLSDSIILTYRNPDNPLDTLRKAFPFNVSKSLTFKSAAYYDTDANGYVDSVFVAIDGPITKDDIKDLTKKILLPSYRLLNVDTVKVVTGGIAYIVKCKMSKPSTSTTSEDNMVISSGILPNGGIVNGTTLKIQDKMAPVLINEASLVTSNLKTDSLKVTFSEPVEKFSHENPFLFSKPEEGQYKVTLGTKGNYLDDNKFIEQISFVQDKFIISSGDSVWINPSAKIRDTSGNIQTIATNQRVLMNVKYQPYTVEPSVINNPMKPDYVVPQFINKLYTDNHLPPPNDGMILVVKPGQDLPPSVKMDAKVTIYDVAKNIIQKDLPMLFEPDSQKLYMVWSQEKAINRNGRKVATGTYLAVVTITDNHGMTQIRKIPIGIRR